MSFTDLDTSTWLLSGLSLVVCVGIVSLDVYYRHLRLPVRSRAALILIGTLVFFCAGGVYETISNASDASHREETGPVSTIHEIYLGHNRSLYLARVLNANPTHLLNFSSEALKVLREHRTDQPYRLGYLDDPQEFYENGRQGFYFKVVDIRDPESSESYYHFDTMQHPSRAVIYLGDILLLLLTAFVVSRLADASPDTEDDFENYRDSKGGRDTEVGSLTSLNLGASDTAER
jgi:hypothetical protein